MCGLCGFTGEVIDRNKALEKMTDLITHRGPDSVGFFVDNDISMGFRRLSIIDLENGNQPLYNEDNTLVLTFNGEIYNYKELREQLIEKIIFSIPALTLKSCFTVLKSGVRNCLTN